MSATPTESAAPAGRVGPDVLHLATARLDFVAETSRLLAASLDLETTLATGAGLALPRFGSWCMVDVVE
ncbi:MAG TPA: hypothetical protein VFH27_06905, partial [Longimicrobiaceae bacterium]|nr:hypothetical protein [Longimicrobiaceae bacterium]